MYRAAYDRFEAKELRHDLRAGVLAAITANANRDPKKRRKPYAPSDFFPALKRFSKRRHKQTWQQQLEIVKMLNQAFGGRSVKRRRRRKQELIHG